MHSDYREGTFSPTSTRNSLLSDSIVIEPLSSALDRSLFMGVDSISVRNSSHFRLCGEENIINRDRGNTDTTQRNSHSGKPNEEEETRLKKVSKLCYEECKSINGVNIHLARIRVEHLKGVCERRKKLLDELRAKVKDLLSDSPSMLEKDNIPGGIVPKSKYGNFSKIRIKRIILDSIIDEINIISNRYLKSLSELACAESEFIWQLNIKAIN